MEKDKEYRKDKLLEENLPKDPFSLFELWLKEAIDQGQAEPLAANLATVGPDGKPSSRIILIKYWSEKGLVFYTNYQSRKGRELEINPNASLVFFWPDLERQVRLEGIIKKLSDRESDTYFNSRSREARIGALVSDQSKIIQSRQDLENRFNSKIAESKGKEIIRPKHWGGFILLPESIEFWQGREHRLNDRILYILDGGGWKFHRLQP